MSEMPLLSYVPISVRTRALVYYLSVHVLFVRDSTSSASGQVLHVEILRVGIDDGLSRIRWTLPSVVSAVCIAQK